MGTESGYDFSYENRVNVCPLVTGRIPTHQIAEAGGRPQPSSLIFFKNALHRGSLWSERSCALVFTPTRPPSRCA